MLSIRPSMRGWFSITAMSVMISVIRLSIFQPRSVCAISRPLKRTVTLALLPSSRKRRTCLALKSKSWVSVLGPSFTSFTWITVCFLRASFCRRDCMYLYFPKSMIRQTGGTASPATSTRSMSRCLARSSAWAMGRIPSCSPSALTTRTSRTRMPSLTRISFDAIAVAPCGRGRRSGRPCHGEGGGTPADLGRELAGDAFHRDGPHVLAGAPPETRRALLGLALPHHEHVGDLPELGVADPVPELLVAVVELDAHPRLAEAVEHALAVRRVLLADGQHARLHRGQPRRERPREVLGEDGDEALERAEDRPVDGHRPLGLPVGVDVLELEALGQHGQIELGGADLPVAPKHVLDVDVDLGPVERPVARLEVVGEPVGPQRVVQRGLGGVPLLGRAEIVRRPRGQLERRRQVEQLVEVADQPEHAGNLVLDLVG